MQSLWSRAGQAHRCGCRACSTAVNSFGRRATTATRRKPTFAELFTACYSSVFATAAVVDAVRKEDRRKELDRLLEEAKRELTELKERDGALSEAPSSSSDLRPQQEDLLWRSLKSIYNERPYMKEIDKPAELSLSELVSNLKREHYRCPSEAALRSLRKTNYDQLSQAIVTEEHNEAIEFREAQNTTQLLNETVGVEQLVTQLLERAEIHDKSASPSPSYDEAKAMMQIGPPGFTFSSIDPARAQRNTSELNQLLRSVVAADGLGLKEKIGRVCYNLMVSAYPPNMHTYNTLIVAFDKSGQHVFADALVNSFFHWRLLRPTPSTFVAILNHYKETNNHGRFLRALACLTGLDTLTGGKIRRRHVDDIEAYPVLQRWAAHADRRTLTGQFVWEHVPLHRPLIEAVISGFIHFKLFDQAAVFFISCLRSGTTLSSRVTMHLLDECVAALDWRAAYRLIRFFANRHLKWRDMLMMGNGKERLHFLERTFALLDICGIRLSSRILPSSDFLDNLGIPEDRFHRFVKMMNGLGFLPEGEFTQTSPLVYDRIRSVKSRLLQFESIMKEYTFVRKTTQSIESKLLDATFSPDLRVEMALHVGESALLQTSLLSEESAEILTAENYKVATERDIDAIESEDVEQQTSDRETSETTSEEWLQLSNRLHTTNGRPESFQGTNRRPIENTAFGEPRVEALGWSVAESRTLHSEENRWAMRV